MTEREKMLAGQLYDCGDPELLAQWHRAKDLVRDYNQADSADREKKEQILRQLLGGMGENLWITVGVQLKQPFRAQQKSPNVDQLKRPNNPDFNLVTPSPLPTQPQVSCRFAKKLSPASSPENFHHAA